MSNQNPTPDAALEEHITENIQSEIERAEKTRVFSRPWHEGWNEDAHLIEDDQSSWLLTMVDLMTLLLTMFVLLAAYAYQSKDNTVTMVASSGSTQQAQKVDKTPTPQTGPMPTTKTSPGEKPTQGNIPQAGNALIGKAGETIIEHSKPSAAGSSANDKASQDQARALFAGLGKDVGVSVVKGRINLRVKDNILFSSGNSALSGAGTTLLKRLADRLKAGDYPIAVQGHTDNVPIHTLQFPSNWELSAARAAAVVQALIASGVQPDRLSAVGFADTRPIANNDTVKGRAENRRVDLELQLPASMLSKVIAGTKPAPTAKP